MFSRPNCSDTFYEIADYLEYKCIQTESAVSSLSYRSLLSVSDDEIDNEGIDSADDLSVDSLDCAIAECHNRSQCCPDQYPFVTGLSSLELKENLSWNKDIYTFLLLATRLNMSEQKVQAGYDGTELFEKVCAIVAKEYYGAHSKVKIFGTSEAGTFKDKVQDLLSKLHVKGVFQDPEGSTKRQKDGKLDIVAWIPFSDRKDGQMIALGQCKTGTNWEGKLTELDPEAFFSCYSTRQPYVKPVKMFFVADCFGNYKWGERCIAGGVLFDRIRIMEYLPSTISEDLLTKIRAWNSSAISLELDN